MVPEPERWTSYLRASFKQRRFANFGPLSSRFELELAEHFGGGQRNVLLVSSCTAGLTASLLALDVRGSVILPAFTFPATAQAVLAAGLKPIFQDVSPETWELTPETVKSAVRGGDVGAILHVRAFGFVRDLTPMQELSQSMGLPLVVDAAGALGGKNPDGTWAGLSGNIEVFSMHATKPFGIGEGGAIFAMPELLPALREVINFGIRDADIVSRGLNAKMSEFAAAVGLAVLDSFAKYASRRREIAHRYRDILQDLPAIQQPLDPGDPVWQTYPVRLPNPAWCQSLITYAAERELELRSYYVPPLHKSSFFTTVTGASASLPVTESLAGSVVCLPIYSDMSDEEFNDISAIVCDGVRELDKVET